MKIKHHAKFKPLGIVTTLILVSFACQTLIPTDTPPPTPSAAPTATQILAPTSDQPVIEPEPEILSPPFIDDFSEPADWYVDRDEISIIEYAYAGLRMYLNKPDYLTFTNVNVFAEDVIIEVDAEKIGGPDDNSFGVVCRQIEDTYYYFEISSDGFYAIGKFINNEFSEILPWGESEAINQGNATNLIHVECVGNTLRFAANGILLAEAQDDSIRDGYLGLVVGTFEIAGVDILFDNFKAFPP
jgi:hypothetical protein